MIHICPVEITAFFLTIPFFGWLWKKVAGCCARCCGDAHQHGTARQVAEPAERGYPPQNEI